MLKWLKKHFIPHEDNNHQPHFLRMKNIRMLALVIFVVELGVLALPVVPILNPANSFLASIIPSVLDDLTNQNRQSQHLAVLTINPVLNKVAEMKAKDMAEKSYFAHVSPDGKQPWYWFKLAGYNYEYAGENLAVNFTDSKDVTLGWMNSPTHRANILKNVFTEIGTAMATGTYEGYPTVFVVQVYGKPAKVGVISEPTKPTKPVDVAKEVNSSLTNSSPQVMGESVKAVQASTSKPAAVVEIVDTKSTQDYAKTTIFEKYLTAPRHMANIVFIILASLVTVAILFKLFIRMDKKHPTLITNGLIVLLLIFSVYTANNLIAKNKTLTTTTFASFQGEQFK